MKWPNCSRKQSIMWIKRLLYLIVFLPILHNGYSQKDTYKEDTYNYRTDRFHKAVFDSLDRLDRLKKQIEDHNAVLNARVIDLIDNIAQLKKSLEHSNRSEERIEQLLEETLAQLFSNNAILREKESALTLLQENYAALGFENSRLESEMSNLLDELASLNAYNDEYERSLERYLIENENLKSMLAAKQKVLDDIFFKNRVTVNQPLYNFSLATGAGTSFSGLGISLEFKYGKRAGIGFKGGVGYLPKGFLTEGIYVNIGLSMFITENLYIDCVFNRSILHISGIEYRNTLSFATGYNFYFDEDKRIGIKLAPGVLFTKSADESGTLIIGDLGLIYRL